MKATPPHNFQTKHIYTQRIKCNKIVNSTHLRGPETASATLLVMVLVDMFKIECIGQTSTFQV